MHLYLQLQPMFEPWHIPTTVLVGAGSLGAAVAMVGLNGDYYTEGAKGVIRLTQVNQMGPAQAPVQVDRERCVIEGVVDGLTPGAHGLAIHETGDVSRFEVSNIFFLVTPT